MVEYVENVVFKKLFKREKERKYITFFKPKRGYRMGVFGLYPNFKTYIFIHGPYPNGIFRVVISYG